MENLVQGKGSRGGGLPQGFRLYRPPCIRFGKNRFLTHYRPTFCRLSI